MDSVWREWLTGPLAADRLLWGQPTWLWARWGKLGQLLGAFAIVVELIGRRRWQIMHGRLTNAIEYVRHHTPELRDTQRVRDWAHGLSALTISAALFLVTSGYFTWWIALLIAVAFFTLLLVSLFTGTLLWLIPALPVFALHLAAWGLLKLASVSLRLLLRALEYPTARVLTQIGALALVVLGTCFDFLGS